MARAEARTLPRASMDAAESRFIKLKKMYQKEEIIEALGSSAKEVTNWLETQADEKFNQGPEGKWDTSQHLDHLHKTASLISKALKTPKMILRAQFGKPNREGRDYDGVVKKYRDKLAITDTSKNGFAGDSYGKEDKEKQIEAFKKQVEKVQKNLKKWSEKDLDNYLVPHPLLGKMTIREIMMWTSYHHLHHLETLEENY